MTKDDKNFLAVLKNELLTQSTDGNADPVFWGIMETQETIVPSGCGEEKILEDGENIYTLEEYIENVNEAVETEEEEKLTEEWANIDKTDICDVIEFANKTFKANAEIVEVGDVDRLSTYTGAFITKRAAEEYVRNNKHNHERCRTYAMTAIRNYEYDRLIKILKNLNLNDIKED